MIGVIAALPREVAGLVRGVKAEPALRRDGVFRYRRPGAVVVCAGMGSERATLAVLKAMELGALTTLISVGLAGGCDPMLRAGAVVMAASVVDALTGERWTGLPGEGVLVTTHTIAGVEEKERLQMSYGAAVVDMEAAAVARSAERGGMGFRAVKAVSDAHDFELSTLARFGSAQGQFRTGAFALHTALRPHRWKKTMELGANSKRALEALNKVLIALCDAEAGR